MARLDRWKKIRDDGSRQARNRPPWHSHSRQALAEWTCYDAGKLHRSRSPTQSRSRRMNAPCSRRTDSVQCHHLASLAHRLGLALAERTHLALAGRTRCNVIAPHLSRNEAPHDTMCPKSSRCVNVCNLGKLDAGIFQIITRYGCSSYPPIDDVVAPAGKEVRNQEGRSRRLPRTPW